MARSRGHSGRQALHAICISDDCELHKTETSNTKIQSPRDLPSVATANQDIAAHPVCCCEGRSIIRERRAIVC